MSEQKVALVTGSGRGIGAATARKLAGDGFKVVVNYAHSKEKAETLAEEIGGVAMQADVSDESQVKAMVGRIEEQLGRLDVLVNNAGILAGGNEDDWQTVSYETYKKILDVNVWGSMVCARVCAPLLAKSEGAIVNTSSIVAAEGFPFIATYSMSKAAITNLTGMMAKSLAPKVRVNAVAPGATETEMLHQALGDDLSAMQEAALMHRVGKTEDIAGAVSYLASDNASFVDGQVLTVDGGR